MRNHLILSILFIFSSSAFAQIHRTELSSALAYDEVALNMTCAPCQGNQLLLSKVEGTSASNTDDYLSLDLVQGGTLLQQKTFPEQSAVNDYTIFEDAAVKTLLDTTGTSCQGYILVFTARTNQAFLPGTSYFMETHAMRLDASLNVVWHKILLNNVGFSSYAVDLEVDHSLQEAVILMRKNGNRTMLAQMDLSTGTTTMVREYDIILSGSSLSTQPRDMITTPSWPGVTEPKFAITGTAGGRVYLLTVEANLAIERRMVYDIDSDGIHDEVGTSIAVLDDNIFLAGTVESVNTPVVNTYSYVMRVQGRGRPSDRGTVRWTQRIAAPDNGTVVKSIAAAEDGTGIILAGQSNILEQQFTANTEGTPFLMKVDGSGSVLWARDYHDSSVDQGQISDVHIDGSLICACGSTWPDDSTLEFDILYIGTDATGVVNTICDTALAVVDQPLVSLRTSTVAAILPHTATDLPISSTYAGSAWNDNSCLGTDPAVLSGIKWIDENCNGVLDGVEAPVPGWVIELRDVAGNILQTTTTDAGGGFSFSVYVEGSYYISEINQTGYDQGTPANNAPYFLQIQANDTINTNFFGNCPCDDIIGYNPIPDWYDPQPPFKFYVQDAVEFDGRIIAIDDVDHEIALWDDLAGSWSVVYTHPTSMVDVKVFDGKLFLGGTAPGWFDSSIYTGTPVFNALTGLLLHVIDYEEMGGDLYAAGSNGTTSNIWTTASGTPNFNSTSNPFSVTSQVDQIGAHGSELVVVGPFGTTLSTSQNILAFTPVGAVAIRSLSTQGLNGYIGPRFENTYDIISLQDRIHVSGRFSDISGGGSSTPNSRGYAVFDDDNTSPTFGTWLPNLGTSWGNPYDMDLHSGHVYIVGYYGNIAGTTYGSGVVYDGSTYHPLDNNYQGNVLYGTALTPSGKDKLMCASEENLEFAECGGDNCAAELGDTVLCPLEPHVFLPFLSFPSGTYLWDFGEGNTSTMRTPSHSYLLTGSYLVTLSYDDGNGCAGNISATVDVIDRPDCDFASDPEPWEKLYGDFQFNTPVKVKRTPFNEVLVLGNVRNPNGTSSTGTLSKFDAVSGSLIWHFKILDPVQFRDIEYNLTTREYLIVGYTDPFRINGVDQDNASVIIKVTDNGSTYTSTTAFNVYQQLGREYFEEITRHEYPVSGANGHDFYFTGARNYAGSTPPPPSDKDEHVIGSIDINRSTGAGSWYTSTTFVGDDEYQKGLFTIPSGQVISVGNSFPGGNNYGIILEQDPVSGAYVNGIQMSDIIDLYDGKTYTPVLPAMGDLYVVVGQHFGSREALITLVTNDNNTVLDAVRVPEIKQFEEVYLDQYGNYYVVGQSKDAADNGRNIVVKFHVVETGAPATVYNITMDWAKYIDDGESQYERAHIYVDNRSDFIYYADGRHDNSSGYLHSDMLVMVTDLDMTTSDCIEDETITFNHITIPTQTITPTVAATPLSSPFSQHVYNDLDYLCNDICIPPCVLDWTWIQDDCYGVQFTSIVDPSLASPISYEWDIYNDAILDYTTANPYHDFLAAGSYDVCLTVSDASGYLCGTVCKTITVGPDTRLPSISCPPSIFRSIPACDRGINVNFAMPIAMDCADSLTVTCSHQSGDFFPCGVTTVTCSATDQEGNTTNCSFQVRVSCSCITMSAATLECGDAPDTYNFNIDVTDLTGSNNNCSPPILSANQSGVILQVNSQIQTSTGYNIMGTLTSPVCPAINAYSISAQMTCTCMDGLPITCNTSISIPAVCCDSVTIQDLALCRDSVNIDVAASFYGMVKDISRTNWYVMSADTCPDTLWTGVPFQSTPGYQDLRITPGLFDDKICYQVEVLLGADEGPCKRLISPIKCMEVCERPSCSMTANQEYCYTGTPIVPAPIDLSVNIPDCDYTIEWFLVKNGNRFSLSHTDTLRYQPPALSITLPTTCKTVTTYEAILTGPCGPISCQSSITLYNDTASLGKIDIVTMDSIPICYGEDLSLAYMPNCLESDQTWTWYERPDTSSSWTPIPGAGTRNTLINTNPLYDDISYRVETQNGVCPVKDIIIDVPVKNPLEIGPLQFAYQDSCCSGGVDFSIDVNSCNSGGDLCDCYYESSWYKDGLLVHRSTHTTSPATWIYRDTTLDSNYVGNYQVIIKDLCCDDSLRSNVASLKAPPALVITGPCYTCDSVTSVTLNSGIINPLMNTASYQWYRVVAGSDVLLLGEISDSLQTSQAGVYRLVVTYSNGCILETVHQITNCSTNSAAVFSMALQQGSYRFQGSMRGLQMQMPDGTPKALVVDGLGNLQVVPCVPIDPALAAQSIQMESQDIITQSATHGLVFDYVQDETSISKILTVDNSGALWFKATTTADVGDVVLEAGMIEFQSEATGLILTAPNGNHYRIMINGEGKLITENVKPVGLNGFDE